MKDTVLKKIKFGHAEINQELGDNTLMFIRFYFRNPYQLMNEINDQYIEQKKYRNDMFPVFFTHTEHLNRDLYQFLLSQNFPAKFIKSILELEKINPVEGGRNLNQYWQKYYSEETKKWVQQKERLLFEIFPEYNL